MSGRDDNDTRRTCGPDSEFAGQFKGHQGGTRGGTSGRWPANLILDSDAAAMLDAMTGTLSVTGKRTIASRDAVVAGTAWGTDNHRSTEYAGDSGGASRFFFRADYDEGDMPVLRKGARMSDRRPMTTGAATTYWDALRLKFWAGEEEYDLDEVVTRGQQMRDELLAHVTTLEAALAERDRMVRLAIEDSLPNFTMDDMEDCSLMASRLVDLRARAATSGT